MLLLRTAVTKMMPGWSRDEVMRLSTRELVNYVAAVKYLEKR